MAKKKQDAYEEAKEQGTTLDAFVIPQRVKAFAETYQPCQEKIATETFDETRLRNFFKAWPTGLGDPLSIYLGMLESYQFRLTVGRTGDLAIFVTERIVGGGAIENLLESSNC